jgi:hypothetical protein
VGRQENAMVSKKLYFRLLALFTAVLALSQAGWAVYVLTPRRPEPRPKFLRMPEVSSPTFKYEYREPMADDVDVVHREVAVPVATGKRILHLLRHAKTYNATREEYLATRPEERGRYRHFYPDIFARLQVYENGSQQPTLSITFLQAGMFETSRPRNYETYFIPDASVGEFNALLETIDPRIKEAREIEENARNKEL